ncbi:hypothetical protein J6590_003476 [Homalodisca vitripennis]|nr:hypothetical protein J6590_003476 [Homalodisca vitripennis]
MPQESLRLHDNKNLQNTPSSVIKLLQRTCHSTTCHGLPKLPIFLPLALCDFRTTTSGRAGGLLARIGSLSGYLFEQQPRLSLLDLVMLR